MQRNRGRALPPPVEAPTAPNAASSSSRLLVICQRNPPKPTPAALRNSSKRPYRVQVVRAPPNWLQVSERLMPVQIRISRPGGGVGGPNTFLRPTGISSPSWKNPNCFRRYADISIKDTKINSSSAKDFPRRLDDCNGVMRQKMSRSANMYNSMKPMRRATAGCARFGTPTRSKSDPLK